MLEAERQLSEFLAAAPTDMLHRFEGAHSPSDVIRIAAEYMSSEARQRRNREG